MAEHQAATTPPPPAKLLPVAVLLWLAGVYLRIPVLVAPPLAPFISDELALTQALTGALPEVEGPPAFNEVGVSHCWL